MIWTVPCAFPACARAERVRFDTSKTVPGHLVEQGWKRLNRTDHYLCPDHAGLGAALEWLRHQRIAPETSATFFLQCALASLEMLRLSPQQQTDARAIISKITEELNKEDQQWQPNPR